MESEEKLIQPTESKKTPTWIWIICILNFLYLGRNMLSGIALTPLFLQKRIPISYVLISIAGIIACGGLIAMKKWALYAYTIICIVNLIMSTQVGGLSISTFIFSAIALSIVWSYEKKMTGENNTGEEEKEDETDISISEIPYDPISTYSASEIKSQINSPKSSFLGGSDENIQVEFADGVKGSIFYIPSKNEYYFNEKSKWGISNHYDNFNNCTNAMHYFKTEGRVLKLGHLGTYS